MAVYVDDAHIPAKVGSLDRRWCHLMADTPEELHAFAAQLGLKRSWFQDHKPFWHYDVTEGMRAKALALGAQPVTSREAVSLPHWQRDRESTAAVAPLASVTAIGSRTQPEPAEPQELAGHEQADRWAQVARERWTAGRLAEAAAYNHACRRVDENREPLWRSRAERLLEAASRQSLSVAYQVRLAVAGITTEDPGLRQLAAHNESARTHARARTQPQEREAAQ